MSIRSRKRGSDVTGARRVTRALLAAIVAAAAALLVGVPSGGSDAAWVVSATSQVRGPSADVFEAGAVDVPDPRSPRWPEGRVGSVNEVVVSNESVRQSGWVNVTSARVRTLGPADGTGVRGKAAVDYSFGGGSCAEGGGVSYWAAKAPGGGGGEESVFSRSQVKVAGATVPAGGSRVLCPRVRLDYPDTVAGRRAALLNHAGRTLGVESVVNVRAEAPSTWVSSSRTVTSRFEVAMPSPQEPSSSEVCRTTTSGGSPNAWGYYGGFFWGWPDAPSSSTVSSPAMAGGWQILRRDLDGSGWSVWATVADGSRRSSAGHDSNDISDRLGQVREFKLRGYPFAGDRSRYVESAWIARAHNTFSIFNGRWVCDAPTVNPDAGGHNLP